VVCRLFIVFINMIGKVQNDSFQGLRIQIGSSWDQSEPLSHNSSVVSPSLSGDSLSRLDKECLVGWGRPHSGGSSSQTSSLNSPDSSQQQQNQGQQSSRYKTEMCRPFQEHGTCKYGDKCQFAHGTNEVRNVNRHPKYKTDLCRTYHSVGFCPYGPRCHFIHALEEMQKSPERLPEKKVTGPIKQLPMYGGPGNNTNDTWTFQPQQNDMAGAVRQLNKYFNMSGGRNGLNSSAETSRSGSFCSDVDSASLPSSSPPPSDDSRTMRLPIFNRLA
jgi:butyrate response factor 1